MELPVILGVLTFTGVIIMTSGFGTTISSVIVQLILIVLNKHQSVDLVNYDDINLRRFQQNVACYTLLLSSWDLSALTLFRKHNHYDIFELSVVIIHRWQRSSTTFLQKYKLPCALKTI